MTRDCSHVSRTGWWWLAGWLLLTSATVADDSPAPPAPTASPPGNSESLAVTPDSVFQESAFNPDAALPAPVNEICTPSDSGYRFTWAPDKWAQVGAALRISGTSATVGQPGGGNYLTIENARLLFSGKVHQSIAWELNTDVNLDFPHTPDGLGLTNAGEIALLDAIAKFELHDSFNVWVGRFLTPSDRSNIDGPFNINGWDFPFVSNYPAIFQGRDNQVTYWGQWGGGQVKWSLGLLDGTGRELQSPYTDPPDEPPNANGAPKLATRITVNFLDPEPGYYHKSTYYGEKDILALAFAMQTQANAFGTASNRHDFTGWSFDGLYETKLNEYGSLTVETAYYNFSTQDLVTSSLDGQAGLIFVGYLLPWKFGGERLAGRLRPFTRYQKYNRTNYEASVGQFDEGLDLGLEYVIKGPSARVTAFWGNREVVGSGNMDIFRVGVQVVY